MSAKIISVLNHKGGSAKTETVFNLAAALRLAGHRVLMVDLDSQSNLTESCGLFIEEGEYDITHSIVRNLPLQALSFDNLPDLLPSSIDLATAHGHFSNNIVGYFRLRDILSTIREQYDYIVIDNSPSLDFLAINSLNAADEVIIPVECKPKGLRGISAVINLIDSIQSTTNEKLRLSHILLTRKDNTALSKQTEEFLREQYGKLVAKSGIPSNVSVPEASAAGISVMEYAPQSKGAEAYEAFAKEVDKVGLGV
ncbi:sporulation initiation inhibitor Soj (plasmid) [Fulvitalea axinellae]|uniref:Sporulation initiation inhibitor Soj n=1 Tax=Fulvitalea axinellae TaxID=1182444 RepID=A0AAU9DEJ5_9BACT|nr:sporulation initiation inhibitor Soj [Fulvitalea axinellae]